MKRAWLVLLLLFASPAWADSSLSRDTQAKILFLSDPHVCEGLSWDATINGAVNTNADQWAKIIDWGCDQGADAIVVTGDLTVSRADLYAEGCTSRFKAFFEGVIAGRAVLLPTAGNHDTEASYLQSEGGGGEGPDGLGPDPFIALQDSFPNLFHNRRSYYAIDIGPVRYLACNNLADTTLTSIETLSEPDDTTYVQDYMNCNPPFKGYQYWLANGYESTSKHGNPNGTNPDFGGITSALSTQRYFIRDKLDDPWPIWKVLGMHRGVWSPYPQGDGEVRSSLLSARYDLWAEATAAGVDLIFQGDQHIIYWSKRIATYPSSATVINKSDSTGAMSIGTHGQYVRRSVDESEMPAGSLIFSKGGSDSLTTKWIYGMFATFTGNRCELQMVRTAQGPSPSYPLRVVTVARRAILAEGRRDF